MRIPTSALRTKEEAIEDLIQDKMDIVQKSSLAEGLNYDRLSLRRLTEIRYREEIARIRRTRFWPSELSREARQWCRERDIDYSIYGGSLIFFDKDDELQFLLTWS